MNMRQFTNFEFRKRLPSEFGGERMYVTARSDARVLKLGWDGCAYDLQLVARHIIEPGMCVWDVGANLGIMSVLAAYRVGSSGAVYALEADPAYADRIFRSSQRLSGSYQPVNVLCAAIANRDGILEFAIAKQGHARNKLLGLADDSFEVEARKMVPTIRGDELLETWRAPDFIKMDVEGAEYGILEGLKLVTHLPKQLLVEYHHRFPGIGKQKTVDSIDMLRGLGYRIFGLSETGREVSFILDRTP